MSGHMVTYRFRVKDKHRASLNRQARAVNHVWNYCNDVQKQAEVIQDQFGMWVADVLNTAARHAAPGGDKVWPDIRMMNSYPIKQMDGSYKTVEIEAAESVAKRWDCEASTPAPAESELRDAQKDFDKCYLTWLTGNVDMPNLSTLQTISKMFEAHLERQAAGEGVDGFKHPEYTKSDLELLMKDLNGIAKYCMKDRKTHWQDGGQFEDRIFEAARQWYIHCLRTQGAAVDVEEFRKGALAHIDFQVMKNDTHPANYPIKPEIKEALKRGAGLTVDLIAEKQHRLPAPLSEKGEKCQACGGPAGRHANDCEHKPSKRFKENDPIWVAGFKYVREDLMRPQPESLEELKREINSMCDTPDADLGWVIDHLASRGLLRGDVR